MVINYLLYGENRRDSVRRKIYPVAIIISLPLVLLIFYIINQGHFKQLNHPSIESSIAKQNNILFIGYDVKWIGFGHPKLKQIYVANDGDEIINHDVRVTSYIEKQPLTELAVNTEKEVDAIGLSDKLIPVQDYKVSSSSFRLIIKIEYENEKALEELEALSIKYNTFGIMKEQQLHFKR